MQERGLSTSEQNNSMLKELHNMNAELQDTNEKMDEMIDDINDIAKWAHGIKSTVGIILGIMVLSIIFSFMSLAGLAGMK